MKFTSHKSKVLVTRKKKELKDTMFGIADDLAPQIHKRLQTVKNLSRNDKCWSADGKIKYIKNGESTIKITKNERGVEQPAGS